jgi:hypothetical protein
MASKNDTTYKGDSPGKALVRIRTWGAIRATMSRLGIPFQGAMVLAGEGGDLGVLDGMGFDMSKIVAVDRDPFMVEWCKHHYPDVIPGTGELRDITASGILPYNTAHIDLCGGIRKADNILTVARVAQGIHSHPAVIAVTMIKGREGQAEAGLMGVPGQDHHVKRSVRRRLQLEARKKGDRLAEHVYSGKPFQSWQMLENLHEQMKEVIRRRPEGEYGVGLVKKNGKPTTWGMALQRAIILQHTVEYLWEAWGDNHNGVKMNLPPGERLHMQQVGLMAYHSGTKKGGGTPFVTALYLVHRTSQQNAIRQWLLRCEEESHTTGNTGGALPYTELSLKEALESFNPTIAAMARVQDHKKVARMFGIDPKSIPAILAHDTRGTYKGKALWQARKMLMPEAVNEAGWGGHPTTDADYIAAKAAMVKQVEAWVAAGNNVESFPGFGEIEISNSETESK